MKAKDAILNFSKGLFNTLNSSMQVYEGMSNSSKGTGREECLKALLEACLPNKYSVIAGDIIDTQGNNSGQIDGIAIYSSAPLLKVPMSDVSLVPAESSGAVFELKSSLDSQWSQVVEKYKKIEPISWKPINTFFVKPKDSPKKETLSFHVISFNGYKKSETLKEKLDELIALSKKERTISIMTLNPPSIVLATEEMKTHIGPGTPEGAIGQWLSYVASDLDSYFNPKPNMAKYFNMAFE